MSAKYLQIIFCVILFVGTSSGVKCWAGDEVAVANQVQNLKTIITQPEVFLVKVTEINDQYYYCKGIIDGIECYIEPLVADTCGLSQDHCALRVGSKYLMALYYSNPDLRTIPVSICDVSVGNIKGRNVTIAEVLRKLPDTFIATNMDGCFIRPVESGDLRKEPDWRTFTFYPGIPSYSSLCKELWNGNANTFNSLKSKNFLSRMNLWEIIKENETPATTIKTNIIPVPRINRAGDLPKLNHDQSQRQDELGAGE